jgi:ribosomal-protein-alanine N-acetyltransferase
MGMDSRLRPASRADVAALAVLERAAFDDPWSPAELTEALGWSGAIALVADGADGIAGYVLGRVVVDEAEILSIAVDPELRRAGLGRALLDGAVGTMIARGARAVWLEVRVSNGAARAMYGAAGFIAAGLRRGYYRQPPEDALVLRRDLTAGRVNEV